MTLALRAAVLSAAFLFIVVSAAMNATFLSSLGRSTFESCLFAVVSIAADIAKAVLPVLIVRAIALRAWGQCATASVMISVVVALSLASGTGFTALTRGTVVAERETQTMHLVTQKQDLVEAEARIAALPPARPVSIIEAELNGTRVDPRWSWSKSCADIRSPAIQKFCAEVSRLRTELATATARDSLTARRQGLRDGIRALGQAGAGTESDPQASAIAALLGIDRSLPRLVMTSSIAVVLELGSIFLILLAAGPTLRDQVAPPGPSKPVTLSPEIPNPEQRAYWQKRREMSRLKAGEGVTNHAR